MQTFIPGTILIRHSCGSHTPLGVNSIVKYVRHSGFMYIEVIILKAVCANGTVFSDATGKSAKVLARSFRPLTTHVSKPKQLKEPS